MKSWPRLFHKITTVEKFYKSLAALLVITLTVCFAIEKSRAYNEHLMRRDPATALIAPPLALALICTLTAAVPIAYQTGLIDERMRDRMNRDLDYARDQVNQMTNDIWGNLRAMENYLFVTLRVQKIHPQPETCQRPAAPPATSTRRNYSAVNLNYIACQNLENHLRNRGKILNHYKRDNVRAFALGGCCVEVDLMHATVEIFKNGKHVGEHSCYQHHSDTCTPSFTDPVERGRSANSDLCRNHHR